MPYNYDGRKKQFLTVGHFCSWECIKSYSIDMNDARVYERTSLISLMRRHANNGKYEKIACAPKRPALKMFGGILTIDEFRKGSSNVIVTMPWETHLIPTVTSKTQVAVSVPTVNATSSDLVLKRNKPLLRAKSSLESSLGIIRKTK
jgi:hypothetical protein